MKKLLTAFIVSALVILLAFAGGYYAGWHFNQAGPVVIEKEKLVYRERKRDYAGMSCLQLQRELVKSDQGIPLLDIKALHTEKGNVRIRADAALNARTWSREATIRVPSHSKNWKFYLGIGLGAVGGVGLSYGLYRLFK